MSEQRLAALRSARTSAHTVFAEYLQMRGKAATDWILVFEGKECPMFYVGALARGWSETKYRQCIARGKSNVLVLRSLIEKNKSTNEDSVLFFVDNDFDRQPKPGAFPNLYVTRGYSIENELIAPDIFEKVARANFDFSGHDDEVALTEMVEQYKVLFQKYVDVSHDLHKLVFVCRRASIVCQPGSSLNGLIQLEADESKIATLYFDIEELMDKLSIPNSDRPKVKDLFMKDVEFSSLQPEIDWRGKFHISFFKNIFDRFRTMRESGMYPFKRASKVAFDPKHANAFPVYCSFAPLPACLVSFFSGHLGPPKVL